MPKRLFHILLLRHGLTDANAGGVLQGWSQTPLNAIGRRQAADLARHVARWTPPVDALISSDLTRAMQTAEPIAQACNLPIIEDCAWRERGLGELEGRHVGERETWRAASGEVSPPGAETVETFSERIIAALTALPSQHPKHRVIAIVTHGGPIRVILRALCAGSLVMARGPIPELRIIDNCSLSHLTVNRDDDIQRWSLECLNAASHLSSHESGDAG